MRLCFCTSHRKLLLQLLYLLCGSLQLRLCFCKLLCKLLCVLLDLCLSRPCSCELLPHEA
jgi:hypothetical protein